MVFEGESASEELLHDDCCLPSSSGITLSRMYSDLSASYNVVDDKDNQIICMECLNEIDHDSMVIHEGNVPYHFYCLFGGAQFMGDYRDISGFSRLKAEDREIFTTNLTNNPIPSSSSASRSTFASFTEDEEVTPPMEFVNDVSGFPSLYCELMADYAKDDSTQCFSCQTSFNQGDLRIEAGAYFFHFFCLFNDNRFKGKIKDVGGFRELNSDDRDMFMENLENDEVLYDEDAIPVVNIPTSSSSSSSRTTKRKVKPDASNEAALKTYRQTQIIDEEGLINTEKFWSWKDSCHAPPTIKDGITMDPECNVAKEASVIKDENGEPFAFTLSLADFATNRNTYCKVLLLKHDTENKHVTGELCYFTEYKFFVFKSWGRIGTNRGTTVTTTYDLFDDAIAEFEETFFDLTQNKWKMRHYFYRKKPYMFFLDLDYFEQDLIAFDESTPRVVTSSKLPLAIKHLLLKIFNPHNVNKLLDQFGFDLNKAPVDRLTGLHVAKARAVLRAAINLVQSEGREILKDSEAYKKIVEMSNEFHSLVPQNMGNYAPKLLLSQETTSKLSEMMDMLIDIQFVTNVMKECKKLSLETGFDPIDLTYDRLNTNMKIVERDTEEFARIQQYMKNSLTSNSADIVDLVRVDRYAEIESFTEGFGNRMLLWHGTPWANFPGILTQGLRIAPKEAVHINGDALGKGVYFADTASYSLSYCYRRNYQMLPREMKTPKIDRSLLLILADVALGDGTKSEFPNCGTNHSKTEGPSTMKEGFYEHPDGYIIPLSKITDILKHQGRQYCVSCTEQVRIRYLVHVQADSKHHYM